MFGNIFGINISDYEPKEEDCAEIRLDAPVSKGIALKQRLKDLGERDTLSKIGLVHYNSIQRELEELQNKCPHSWEYVHLFSNVIAVCSKCDYEDKRYRHARDNV